MLNPASVATHRLRPLAASVLLGLLRTTIVVAAYESHRVFQVLVLALGPLLWLRLPLQSPTLRRIRFLDGGAGRGGGGVVVPAWW
ncbi:hypothetical protein OU995_05685 [Roseateles sp. SL47]|uniref:hypothetical protein n=1 Tax=Roseateles sp. SL47 TaxID=2995138 RepID=UPI0022718CB7|nr:hypothetical protein [Roseateles sp. SL47]WAC74217.1 hypothetical protein OU995_05685 [Roseateles sp. SL47]